MESCKSQIIPRCNQIRSHSSKPPYYTPSESYPLNPPSAFFFEMSQPIITLSDDDENDDKFSTPLPNKPKRPRINPQPSPIVIDDDPTPEKSKSSMSTPPSVVPETPMSELCRFDKPISKCRTAGASNSFSGSGFPSSDPKLPGQDAFIHLDSDNESGDGLDEGNSWVNEAVTCSETRKVFEWSPKFTESACGNGKYSENENREADLGAHQDFELNSRYIDLSCSLGKANSQEMYDKSYSCSMSLDDDAHPVDKLYHEKENVGLDVEDVACQHKKLKKKNKDEAARKRMSKEERAHMMEEKRAKKEEEKLRREALKAEAAEVRKREKEMQKWEKGKFALESIEAKIDPKVLEIGSIGGDLLRRFSDKGLKYRVTPNPIEKSIVWTMNVPENISQLSSRGTEIQYVLFIYDAEEFGTLAISGSFMDHISTVRSHYPHHTICYLTNRLMSYINKREQEQYKKPIGKNDWRRPPVEEVFAKLATHFDKVHSRQCVDEAEVAEHVVGLTISLANCQFRQKLTRLSVNANGAVVPKDFVERNLILKSPWLKALVAIPKVQPRCAIAIGKKYPTMKSLLKVYMDPTKSEHEKEFLLKDLKTEGYLHEDRRLGEICSKRVYRILMAQNGNMKTDDVENGSDFFEGH